jgi:hypothetical protein
MERWQGDTQMRFVTLLFFSVLTVLYSKSSLANDSREIKIIGQKNSTDCIQLHANISPYEKQPSIYMVNGCSIDFKIKDILIASQTEAPEVSILPLKALRGRPKTSFLQKIELNKVCNVSQKSPVQDDRQCADTLRRYGHVIFWLPRDSYFEILLEPNVSLEGKLADPESWHPYNDPTP